MDPSPPRPRFGRRRLRLLIAVVVVVAVAIAAVVVLGGARDAPPPASDTARLVPASALVYVHLSTDADRDATARAIALARRFPGWSALRDRTVRQLVAAGRRGAEAAEIRPFLGDEAAIALTDRGTGVAGSLVMLEVTDRAAANRYLERGQGTVREGRARGVLTRTFGTLVTAIIGDTLVIGQLTSVREAIELSTGRGRPLADDRSYRRAMEGMPSERAADAWATADGIRRLLAPQPGALGLAGVLLDAPGLRAAALALTADADGARLRVKRLVDADRRRPTASFTPDLAQFLPAETFAFADLRDLTGVAGRFASLVAGSAEGQALLQAARRGGALRLFSGQVGLGLSPGVPASVLTLVARTDDEAAARRAVRTLPRPLVGEVVDGRVIVSTTRGGLRAARSPQPSLAETELFEKAVGDSENAVSSLLFLDFTQLLRLGEQTGLRDSRAYLAVAPDLERIRAVGVRSTAEEGASISEIHLLIP